MEIILRQNVQGLGEKDHLVRVKPGYGRNYLIPKGLAVVANEANRKIAAENIRQAAHKVAQRKEEARALATRLSQLTVEVAVKSGEDGKIFGAVTPMQLAQALAEQDILIDRSAIRLDTPVKVLGAHQAILTLHKEVVYTLTFHVVTIGK